MSAKILSLLHKAVPPAIAARGLSLLDSRIGNFMTGALQSGYTIDTALDYLRNKFSNDEESKSFGNRPDERAAAARVKQGREIPNLIQKGATLGGALLGGISAARGEEPQQSQSNSPSQIAQPPFQAEESKRPPPSPAKAAMEAEQGQAKAQQEAQMKSQQQATNSHPLDILDQYDPGLAYDFYQIMKSGVDPVQAAMTLKRDYKSKYGGIIKGIEDKEKQEFTRWIGSIFGNFNAPASRGQQPNGQAHQQQQGQPKTDADALLDQIIAGAAKAMSKK